MSDPGPPELFPETDEEREFREFQEAERRREDAEYGARPRKTAWWVYPVTALFAIGFAVAFIAIAALLWALTLGGGCALGWCPFTSTP